MITSSSHSEHDSAVAHEGLMFTRSATCVLAMKLTCPKRPLMPLRAGSDGVYTDMLTTSRSK